jgi:uncharacterized repeat protein (TIGR03803 family)
MVRLQAMRNRRVRVQASNQNPKEHRRGNSYGFVAIASAVLLMVLLSPAEAQTYVPIHTFSGGGDGAKSYSGLAMDPAGNLYGTAAFGGSQNCGEGCGTVFRLRRSGSGWVLSVLYSFQGGSDGFDPLGGVTIAPDGSLYGTTSSGGNMACYEGCGTVFHLRPQVRACHSVQCPWTKTTIYQFNGKDGALPLYSALTLGPDGSLYGTTEEGGAHGYGVVFQLTPSGGGWTESTLYSFSDGNDGANPIGGVILDSAGNLYGTTQYGGTLNRGVVYQLVPSSGGWTQNVLSNFEVGGELPGGDLIFDAHSNLYGTTYLGGPQGSGTVFELQPAGGGWTMTILQGFTGDGGPLAGVVMDAAGSLYGTSSTTGGYGVVFKLAALPGGWSYSELHDFNGGDGQFPLSPVILDNHGNVFGTTPFGGAGDNGVVWEITP